MEKIKESFMSSVHHVLHCVAEVKKNKTRHTLGDMFKPHVKQLMGFMLYFYPSPWQSDDLFTSY